MCGSAKAGDAATLADTAGASPLVIAAERALAAVSAPTASAGVIDATPPQDERPFKLESSAASAKIPASALTQRVAVTAGREESAAEGAASGDGEMPRTSRGNDAFASVATASSAFCRAAAGRTADGDHAALPTPAGELSSESARAAFAADVPSTEVEVAIINGAASARASSAAIEIAIDSSADARAVTAALASVELSAVYAEVLPSAAHAAAALAALSKHDSARLDDPLATLVVQIAAAADAVESAERAPALVPTPPSAATSAMLGDAAPPTPPDSSTATTIKRTLHDASGETRAPQPNENAHEHDALAHDGAIATPGHESARAATPPAAPADAARAQGIAPPPYKDHAPDAFA